MLLFGGELLFCWGGMLLLIDGDAGAGADGNDGIALWFVIGTGAWVGIRACAGACPGYGANVSTACESIAHTYRIADLVKFPTLLIAFLHIGSCTQPILKTLKEVQQ